MIDALLAQLEGQVVGGAVALMIAGSVLGLLYRLPSFVRFVAVRLMTAEVVVRDMTAVEYVNEWLASTDYARRCRRLKAELRHPPESTFPVLVLTPGEGVHLLRHRRRWFAVSRVREGGEGKDEGPATMALFKRDVISVRTWGRSADAARVLLDDAMAFVLDRRRREEGVAVKVNDRYHWNTLRVAPHRPLESVVLADGLLERVVADVERFFAKRERYGEVHIPWRRVHLYHGPPGCGKSSIIRALSGGFDMMLHSLDLGVAELDGHGLQMLLGSLPQRSILIVEDVDCHGLERGSAPDADDESTSNVTFSQFLNAFDGVATPEGLFIIFTTNRRPEDLDEAVTRRANLVEYFPLADESVGRRMFLRFFPESPLAKAFGAALPEGLKISALQDLLLSHEDDPQAALEAAGDLVIGEVVDATERRLSVSEIEREVLDRPFDAGAHERRILGAQS